MKRIAIVLPSMAGGGVERVRLLLARQFIDAGHAVEFVVLGRRGELLDDLLPDATFNSLDCTSFRQAPLRLAAYLRHERPDVVLAAMWPLTGIACLANLFTGRRAAMVVSEHNDLRHTPAVRRSEKLVLKLFGKHIYRLADGIVAVSGGVADSLVELTGLTRSEIEVIYNPIRAPSGATLPADDPLDRWWQQGSDRLVAVGHLKRQKGFDTLLRALAILRRDGRDTRLIILGEGRERASLEALIDELGLTAGVRLPGFRPDPFPYVARADLFVLSSRWEGLGNVITEAMACGTPVVSTDCPSGPAELLAHGRFGPLVAVDDPPAMAQAIQAALAAPHDRDALRHRAAAFSPEAAARDYLRLMLRSTNAVG